MFKRLFNVDWEEECVVVFGEDGKICLLRVYNFLSFCGIDFFLFVVDMCKEVIVEFVFNRY